MKIIGIGPGDLTDFPVDPSTTRCPAVFEPIATLLRTTCLREVTQVPMTPASIGNLAGATQHNNRALRKKLQPLTKRRSKKSSE
jgi:hypothetical protein